MIDLAALAGEHGLPALAALGGAGAIAAAAAALPLLRPRRRTRSLQTVVRPRLEPAAAGGGGRAQRRQIDETLRELAERQRAEARRRSRLTLEIRLRQAGLPWSRRSYFVVSAGVGSAVFLASFGPLGLDLLPALGFAAAAGAALPHLYVGRRRSRRLFAVVAGLPDALDNIVRGVRAGLPLGDSLRSIATDGHEPLRSEFRVLVEDLAIGLPLDDAVERMARRTPALEIKLLGVILAIQNRAGGNLSEALGNLCDVLRERKKMRGKIRAMSSEATASAAIIGALPVIVALLLYLTSPDYVGLLFTTSIGHVALAASGVWMLMGVLVMRKMINFEV